MLGLLLGYVHLTPECHYAFNVMKKYSLNLVWHGKNTDFVVPGSIYHYQNQQEYYTPQILWQHCLGILQPYTHSYHILSLINVPFFWSREKLFIGTMGFVLVVMLKYRSDQYTGCSSICKQSPKFRQNTKTTR